MVARIVPRLEALATAPRPPGCKKLKGGFSEWRIRVSDYRAVYETDDAAQTAGETRIAHRREVTGESPSAAALAFHPTQPIWPSTQVPGDP